MEKAFGSVIKINKKGLDWLGENNNLDKIEEKSKIYQVTMVCKNSNIDDNKNVEKKLKDYRTKIAREKGLKLFQIFPNKTIDCLLKVRVNSIKDFRNIEGLGEKRIELYGGDLLNILKDNPLKVTKKQNAYDKLLELGLSLDEISSIKDEFIKEI